MAFYRASWNQFRLLRGAALGLWLGGLPFVGLVILFGDRVLASVPPILALSYMVAFIVAQSLLAFWPCPRCGKSFAFKFGFHQRQSVWPTSCVHCGFEEGSAIDASWRA